MFEKINQKKEQTFENLPELKETIKWEEKRLETLLNWIKLDLAPGDREVASDMTEEIKSLKAKFISAKNIDEMSESDIDKIREIIQKDKVLSGTYNIIKRDKLNETGSFPTRDEAVKELYKTLAKEAQIADMPENRYRDLQVSLYDLTEGENAVGKIELDLDTTDTNKLRELMEGEDEILNYYQKAKKILAKGVPQSLDRGEVLIKMTDLINEKIADDPEGLLGKKFKDILSKSKLN